MPIADDQTDKIDEGIWDWSKIPPLPERWSRARGRGYLADPLRTSSDLHLDVLYLTKKNGNNGWWRGPERIAHKEFPMYLVFTQQPGEHALDLLFASPDRQVADDVFEMWDKVLNHTDGDSSLRNV